MDSVLVCDCVQPGILVQSIFVFFGESVALGIPLILDLLFIAIEGPVVHIGGHVDRRANIERVLLDLFGLVVKGLALNGALVERTKHLGLLILRLA